jgi:hypothetical protein
MMKRSLIAADVRAIVAPAAVSSGSAARVPMPPRELPPGTAADDPAPRPFTGTAVAEPGGAR